MESVVFLLQVSELRDQSVSLLRLLFVLSARFFVLSRQLGLHSVHLEREKVGAEEEEEEEEGEVASSGEGGVIAVYTVHVYKVYVPLNK